MNRAGATADIPSEHAIRGLQGVTLLLDSAQKTAAILTDVFGFREVAREGSMIRFAAAGDAKGSVVDIHEAAGVPRRHQGRGSVHHIAFRAADDAQQAQMSEKLIRDPRPASDRTEGPQVLPLDLLPRTRRHPVRDRDRYSRICGRRAGRGPWSGLEAAQVSRIASQGDRGLAARSRGGGVVTIEIRHELCRRGVQSDKIVSRRPTKEFVGHANDQPRSMPTLQHSFRSRHLVPLTTVLANALLQAPRVAEATRRGTAFRSSEVVSPA